MGTRRFSKSMRVLNMTQREIGQASEKNSDIAYRTERDPVGEMRVPADVLYGIQTLRALENFRVTPYASTPLSSPPMLCF
jgi:hypothetical protein